MMMMMGKVNHFVQMALKALWREILLVYRVRELFLSSFSFLRAGRDVK
jgi:hypothetical protein